MKADRTKATRYSANVALAYRREIDVGAGSLDCFAACLDWSRELIDNIGYISTSVAVVDENESISAAVGGGQGVRE